MKQSLLGIIKRWVMLLALFQLTACGSSGGGNQTPTALGISLSTDEDTALTATLSGADSDGSIAAYTLVAQPNHGTLSGTAPTLTYTPDTDFYGIDSFTFTVTDNGGAVSTSGTVTININPVNDLLSLSLTGLPASTGNTVQATLVTDNFSAAGMQYAWQASGDWSISSGQGTSILDMLAPASSSGDSVSLTASSSTGPGLGAVMPLSLIGDATPVLQSLTFTPQPSVDSWQLATTASDPNTLPLTYSWSSGGLAIGATDSLSWTPPLSGQYRVSVEASNGTQSASGTMEYFHVGATPWPFFRGTREGSGSRIPVDTSSNTGQLKWKTTFTAQSCSTIWNFLPAVAQDQDGTLYVGSISDGKLYAFNPDSGAVKWSFVTAGSNIRSAPAVATDGTIYVAEFGTGIVYAVNPDASQKWEYPAGANITSPIAIGADGTIYVGTENAASSVLVALNPGDGSVKWSFALAAETRGSVNFGADGTVFARDYTGKLYAINPADGSEKWPAVTFGGRSGSSPSIAADGTLYFGSFIGDATSRLYAVNPTDGSEKWASTLGGNLDYGIGATASVGADGTVYIGSWTGSVAAGEVYALDPTDGSMKWRRALDSAIQAGTAIGADGTVYAASHNGTIYALDSADGSEKWTYNTGQPRSPSPLTIGADGSIYAYTCEGVLHAIK